VNTRRKIVLAGTFAALAAVRGYEAHIIVSQRTALRLLQQQSDRISAEIKLLQAADGAALHPSAPTDSQGSGSSPTATTAENPTLAVVRQLKQFFADKPAQYIPELELLSHLDWLDVASERHPTLSRSPLGPHELRLSAERLRSRAKDKFARLMWEAWQRYQREYSGTLPEDSASFGRFFAPSLDPAILARYRVLPSGLTAGLSRGERIRILEERNLADEEYDRRLYFTLNFTKYIAWNFDPSVHTLNSIVSDATWAFAKANHRKPSTPDQLLPYLQEDEKEYYRLPVLQRFWSSPLRRDPLPQVTERDEIRVHEKAKGGWTAEIVNRR
jgi:hypothetical protein